MKIKEKISQHRRDFKARLECEHCGNEEQLLSGYDDTNYHVNVIPKMECTKCGKQAPDTYKPMATVYPDGFQV